MIIHHKKNIETEREWQNKHATESELMKPYWNKWELYHWETIFNKIITNYNFDQKSIFVGGCGSGIFEEWLIKKTQFKPKKIVGIVKCLFSRQSFSFF